MSDEVWTRCATMIRIDENPRADDPAHHRHRRAEEAELAGEFSVFVRRGSVAWCRVMP